VREATQDQFMKDPRGAFVVGRTWLYFYPSAELSGYVVWGSPSVSEFDELTMLMAASHVPPAVPHASLVDVTSMEGMPAATFERLIRFTTMSFDAIRRTMTKVALVRSVGVGSAIASGFLSLVAPFAPFSFFDDPENALAWLGRTDDLPELEEVYRRRSAILGLPPVLGELRDLLDVTPQVTLIEAARSLKMSSRTLQRRLGEAGTSLRREATRARVRKAEKLLLETGATLTEIAYEVGCASAQHFSVLFRSVHGEPPSGWRSKQRQRDSSG
jgi:AraC-like DNA-binding protein